eukprot:10482082-Lingulodinium_polyedra.AAC.1
MARSPGPWLSRVAGWPPSCKTQTAKLCRRLTSLSSRGASWVAPDPLVVRGATPNCALEAASFGEQRA